MAFSRAVLAIPASLGMAVRHRWPQWALGFEPRATRIATGLFLLIVVLAVIKNWALLRDNFATLAPFAIILNVTMLFVGLAAALAVRLSRSQSVTLGIESAVQNAALALVIASLFVICTPLVLYASSQEHIVQPGESLLQIAADYNVSVAALMTVNQIANENLVTIGETLVIPSESDLQMASTEATTSRA